MSAPDFSSFGVALSPVPELPGWFHGPVDDDWVVTKELAGRIRASPAAKGYGILTGMRESDAGHRIYVTPPVSASAAAP
jgi:hypothetical protein